MRGHTNPLPASLFIGTILTLVVMTVPLVVTIGGLLLLLLKLWLTWQYISRYWCVDNGGSSCNSYSCIGTHDVINGDVIRAIGHCGCVE